MSSYLIFRIVKFVFLALLAGGVLGCVQGAAVKQRMRSLQIATLGFVGVWFAGYALMKETSRSLGEPWIVWAMAASLITLHCAAILAHKVNPRPIGAVLTVGSLFAAIAVMSSRSSNTLELGILVVISSVISIPVVWAAAGKRAENDTLDTQGSWDWFRWIARFEGLSLIVLVLIGVPLKKIAGISLDQGTGLIGWLHGVLFLIYIQAAWSTGRCLKWSWPRLGLAMAASLFPFGTFLFEWKSQPKELES